MPITIYINLGLCYGHAVLCKMARNGSRSDPRAAPVLQPLPRHAALPQWNSLLRSPFPWHSFGVFLVMNLGCMDLFPKLVLPSKAHLLSPKQGCDILQDSKDWEPLI
jgi:hypothetical protein